MDTLNSTEDAEGDQQRPNKALPPTAYSLRFGRKLPSLRLPAAGVKRHHAHPASSVDLHQLRTIASDQEQSAVTFDSDCQGIRHNTAEIIITVRRVGLE